jgi:hypothetical protein
MPPLALACLAVLLLLAAPAAAKPTCYPQADVIAALADKHGELPMFSGANTKTDRAMVLFATPDGTSWTAMIQVGDQLCGGYSGDAWSRPDLSVVDKPS